MKKKVFFLLIIVSFFSMISACRNPYEVATYQKTDSYGSVFEGNYVPQDSH